MSRKIAFFDCKLFKNWEKSEKNQKNPSTPEWELAGFESYGSYQRYFGLRGKIIKNQIMGNDVSSREKRKIKTKFFSVRRISFFSWKIDFSDFLLHNLIKRKLYLLTILTSKFNYARNNKKYDDKCLISLHRNQSNEHVFLSFIQGKWNVEILDIF